MIIAIISIILNVICLINIHFIKDRLFYIEKTIMLLAKEIDKKD